MIVRLMTILPSIYRSTIFGTSVRPLALAKAEPRQLRPVTSWTGQVAIHPGGRSVQCAWWWSGDLEARTSKGQPRLPGEPAWMR